LIVEDDPVARTLLQGVIEESGYTVATAANGCEALELLRNGQRPEVILLDLKTPVMSGWEFRDEQRRDQDLAAIPVVILSGDSDLDEAAVSLGAAAAFSKPIEPEELLATIRRLCCQAGSHYLSPE
jgi:CheY-like chemotaxis protein